MRNWDAACWLARVCIELVLPCPFHVQFACGLHHEQALLIVLPRACFPLWQCPWFIASSPSVHTGTQRSGGLTEAQIKELSEELGVIPDAVRNASSTVSWWQACARLLCLPQGRERWKPRACASHAMQLLLLRPLQCSTLLLASTTLVVVEIGCWG